METTTQGTGGSLQLLLLLAFLIPAIFFLLTQQNTLKIIQPANRLLLPGLVWLQLIPVLGQIWQFFVVSLIAGSIRKEIAFRQADTTLGLFDAEAVGSLGKKPTLVIGIAYCTLSVTGIFLNLFLTFGADSPMLWFVPLIALCSMGCWIIYWVQLAAVKKKMATLKLAAA